MSQILLLIENKENRQQLAEWLIEQHQLMMSDSSAGLAVTLSLLDEPFDLGILDCHHLVRFVNKIKIKKESEKSVFLPFLLVTTREEIKQLTPPLLTMIDEFIMNPLEKVELAARVEILLRARRLPIEIKQRDETALQETDLELHTIADKSPAGIFMLHGEGIFYANPAFMKICGRSWEEIAGIHFMSLVHPEDREKVMKEFSDWRTGKDVRDSYVYRMTTPQEVRWLELYPTLIVYQQKPTILGAMLDITERKKLEEQLLQAQKMEAIGTLAGGVAHDFNNLLSAINVNLHLAKSRIAKGQAVKTPLEEIKKVAERATHLTQQLLVFSRRQIIQPIPLNLNDIITDESKMLSRLLGRHIEVKLHLQKDLHLIKADPGQMEQIIMNLCLNARDAMPGGGKLLLETRNTSLEARYITGYPWVQSGDYVMLRVTDSGQGMDQTTQARIFEPFFTTKEPGKGTGLGLSMVYGIVKQHQGCIEVFSQPERGTTFKVYLPQTQEKITPRARGKARQIKGGSETLLLVEDEAYLREAVQKDLETFGYTVLTAADGQEAVEVYKKKKRSVDLVIMDMVMPKLGGKAAAVWIYKINPRQKILFTSGYLAEGVHDSFILPQETDFISKPYTAKALAQKIRQVLDR